LPNRIFTQACKFFEANQYGHTHQSEAESNYLDALYKDLENLEGCLRPISPLTPILPSPLPELPTQSEDETLSQQSDTSQSESQRNKKTAEMLLKLKQSEMQKDKETGDILKKQSDDYTLSVNERKAADDLYLHEKGTIDNIRKQYPNPNANIHFVIDKNGKKIPKVFVDQSPLLSKIKKRAVKWKRKDPFKLPRLTLFPFERTYPRQEDPYQKKLLESSGHDYYDALSPWEEQKQSQSQSSETYPRMENAESAIVSHEPMESSLLDDASLGVKVMTRAVVVGFSDVLL